MLNNTLIIYRNRKVSLKRSQFRTRITILLTVCSLRKDEGNSISVAAFFLNGGTSFLLETPGQTVNFRNTTRKISEFEVFARSRKRERERDVSVFSGLNSEKLIISGKMKHQRKHAQNQPRFTF